MEIITKSTSETQEAGRKLSADLAPGDVIALSGDLGAGKTTFVQGIADGLGISKRINSPTFIIMREYENFVHVDLYRLEGDLKQEMENIGLLDIIREGKSIVVIEWPEKVKEFLPKNTKWIKVTIVDDTKRKIEIS